MVAYSNFTNACSDQGEMCTDCMCTLYNQFKEYNGNPEDLGLCMENMFFGALGLPQNIGGAGVSKENLEKLKTCSVSSAPCTDYSGSITYYTPRLSFDTRSDIAAEYGEGNECLNQVDPQQCAEKCSQSQKCDSFTYNPVKRGGTCCFLSNPPKEVWFNQQGWQTYFRMEKGFNPNLLSPTNQPIKINEIQTVPDLESLELALEKKE
eukprot:TRINITY_DN13613_c0_g1_i2.p1 TRINITY_DN13613_c0_g1~~TRINITY_DN13613_c0_g1_i2.p1  ORF type:complete len:232 (+),score=26.38 TRINITY_DN13613_c0_g1_i2:76-696(+)